MRVVSPTGMICYLNSQVIMEEGMVGFHGQNTACPAHRRFLYGWVLRPTQAQQEKQVSIYHGQFTFCHIGWEGKNNISGKLLSLLTSAYTVVFSGVWLQVQRVKLLVGVCLLQTRICLLLTLTMNPKSSDCSFALDIEKRTLLKWVLPPKPS